MKERLRRALFVASLGATAIAGLAAGTVSAITDPARGNTVAMDLLWTAGGFLLLAFGVAAKGPFGAAPAVAVPKRRSQCSGPQPFI
jgi:hypothetical protein